MLKFDPGSEFGCSFLCLDESIVELEYREIDLRYDPTWYINWEVLMLPSGNEV
jgi:hypothetical protein